MDKLKLLVVIVNRDKAAAIQKLLQPEVSFQFSSHGEGTVESKLKEYLGLTDTSKEVVFAPISFRKVKRVLNGINKEVNINEKGNGIAFTIPLKSVISNLSLDFLQGKVKKGGDRNGRIRTNNLNN